MWLGSIFNLPTIESLNLADTFGTSLLACVYDGVIYSPGVILFNLMELLTSTLFEYLGGLLETLGASKWVMDLFNDGIFAGLVEF